MSRDPIGDARDLITELYPDARWAVLAGSVLTRSRTAGSDLDLVVLLADGDPRAPHRESLRYRNWPVEIFVHDEQTLAHYFARDGSRPILRRMVATGAPLLGDPAPWQEASRAVLAAGPEPLTDQERDWERYALTDLLDDLAHAADPGERTIIATLAWTRSAELALASGRHWLGSGKWLVREVRDFDPEFARRWLAAYGDPDAVAALAGDVLDAAGGPLFDGYRAIGERPQP